MFNQLKILTTAIILASIAFLPTLADGSQVVMNLKTSGIQLKQAEDYYNSGNFKEAQAMITYLRPILSETTELHAQLYDALKDDSGATVTAKYEKDQTIEFAKLRDRANYLAGIVSLKQGNYREAAKHLVLVVQSQRTTGLGEKAYNALRDIGFSPKLNIADQP
jgi:Flp pilus assembly protein TadD